MLTIVVIKLMAPKMEDAPPAGGRRRLDLQKPLPGPGFPPEGGRQFSRFQYRIHFWERGWRGPLQGVHLRRTSQVYAPGSHKVVRALD